MRWSIIFLFAVIFLGGAVVWFGQVDGADLETIPAPRSGAVAPDFVLVDLQGTQHTLDDYQGRPVVLNFWATWCPPCRAEMPALQNVYEEYRDEGLVILAINVRERPSTVQPFVDEYRLTFPVLIDGNAAVSAAYEQEAYPTTYFIDRNGRIREMAVGGPMSEAFIESNVGRIIN